MLNVAIIGSGDTLIEHANTWSNIHSATITAIVDIDNGQTQHELKHLKSIYVTRLDDVSTEKVDVVDVCVPAANRAEWVEQAAAKKLPVMCDMPLGQTLEETLSVMSICKEKGVHCYPGNAFHFAPAFVNAKAQVNNGAIGHAGVVRLSAQTIHPGGVADIFTELGVDLFVWVMETFGNVVRVTAKHTQKTSKKGVPVEYAVNTLRMDGGAIVHVELSWAGKGKPRLSFELTGDKGMISYDSRDNDPILVDEFDGTFDETENDMVLTKSVLERRMEYIVTSIKTNAQSDITSETVLSDMQVAGAASESAKTGEPVSIKRGEVR